MLLLVSVFSIRIFSSLSRSSPKWALNAYLVVYFDSRLANASASSARGIPVVGRGVNATARAGYFVVNYWRKRAHLHLSTHHDMIILAFW